jgi:hypothetical protein
MHILQFPTNFVQNLFENLSFFLVHVHRSHLYEHIGRVIDSVMPFMLMQIKRRAKQKGLDEA